MVDELKFEDHKSPWEHHKKDPEGYIAWAEEKKGTDRIVYPFVTGTGMAIAEGQHVPEGQKVVVKKQDKLEVQA